MKADLSDIEGRLRVAYQAVAATTVVGTGAQGDHAPDRPHRLAPSPDHRRPRRLVPTGVAAAALIAGAAVIMLVHRGGTNPSPVTAIATAPSTTLPGQPETPPTAGPGPMCGSELPRPPDLPQGYSGPQRVASSQDGQLVLAWTSTTGSIVARWPPDPQYQQILGRSEPTADGQPSVGSSGTFQRTEREGGGYVRTVVFSLRNVPEGCRSIQIDVLDSDAARVDAGIARLSNKGLFISNLPLVIASEDRPEAPGVVGCSSPGGVSPPPNRGGPVSGAVHPTATDALKALVDSDSSLIPNQYLEVRLPDGSIAYAKEQPGRPGSFVAVIHVARTGSGWSVDRWQASGC